MVLASLEVANMAIQSFVELLKKVQDLLRPSFTPMAGLMHINGGQHCG
jgi:hypothetical protein